MNHLRTMSLGFLMLATLAGCSGASVDDTSTASSEASGDGTADTQRMSHLYTGTLEYTFSGSTETVESLAFSIFKNPRGQASDDTYRYLSWTFTNEGVDNHPVMQSGVVGDLARNGLPASYKGWELISFALPVGASFVAPLETNWYLVHDGGSDTDCLAAGGGACESLVIQGPIDIPRPKSLGSSESTCGSYTPLTTQTGERLCIPPNPDEFTGALRIALTVDATTSGQPGAACGESSPSWPTEVAPDYSVYSPVKYDACALGAGSCTCVGPANRCAGATNVVFREQRTRFQRNQSAEWTTWDLDSMRGKFFQPAGDTPFGQPCRFGADRRIAFPSQ